MASLPQYSTIGHSKIPSMSYFADVQLGHMPDAETLKNLSLKQFDSDTQASELASKTVTEILSQLSGSTLHAGEP